MLKRYRSAAIAVSALAITSTAVWAAGNYSTYPIVGGASFCVSTVGVNGQAGNTGQTGGTAGTNGAYCAQTVPAGPSIVTGTELVPADTALAGGTPPQTVVLSMASLNALPITYSTISANSQTLTAVATTGGFFVHSTAVGGTITALTVVLPPAPIDGQQFAVSADNTVTTLTMTTNGLPSTAVTVTKSPTTIAPLTNASYGYRFWYNAASLTWNRLQ